MNENIPASESRESQSQESSDYFVQLLTREQISLFRYISGLIGDPNEAGNILQETNIVLWRKASEFVPGTNFSAWARAIALWQVKACLRDRVRDRHVFSPELIQQLAEHSTTVTDVEPRRIALRECVEALRTEEMELLRQRYFIDSSIREISDRLKKSPTAVKSGLFRLRRALKLCVERKIAESV